MINKHSFVGSSIITTQIAICIYLSTDNTKTFRELTGFKTEADYDKFVINYRHGLKNCTTPIKTQYDVRVIHTNGCKVSYTFEYFKNIIFPTNPIC